MKIFKNLNTFFDSKNIMNQINSNQEKEDKKKT